jgi:glycerophosphoryl diester phosphodiesterase
MKMYFFFICVSILLIPLLSFWGSLQKKEQISQLPPHADDWTKIESFYPIAHRLGPSAHTGDNRIATFDKGLAQGFKFFEVDLLLTSDGYLICSHGDNRTKMSYQEYVDASNAAGLAPCHFDDLVDKAQAHPQIYFILDVKNHFEKSYALIKEKVSAKNVGQSFIPQIYYLHEVYFLRKGNIFPAEIFTAYRSKLSTENVFKNVRALNIPVVTINQNRLANLKTSLPKDLLVFTHPVNSLSDAYQFKDRGISGIYTNDLSPDKFYLETAQR